MLNLPFVFDADTGEQLDSVSLRSNAVAVNRAKLQSTVPVRLQFVRRDTGELAAQSGAIKLGFKPQHHYSDPLFDCYTDAFSPVGSTGDDLVTYQASLYLGGSALSALFAPNTDGVSIDSVDLIGEVTVNGVPTNTITLTVVNNVIKGTETPPSLDLGIPLYPTSATVNQAVKQAGLLTDAAIRDYAADCAAWIDGHLLGKTPTAGTTDGSGNLQNAGTVNLFSAGNYTTGTGYVWSTALWCAGLDFTCFSPWNSTENQYQGGTLITPRHVWLANHFSGPAASANPGSNPMAVGTQIKFVGTDGILYVRTFTAFAQLDSSDVLIGTLNADLPAAVRPARFLPPGTPLSLLSPGTPVIFCNKNKEVRVAEVVSVAGHNIAAASATNRAPWTLSGPGAGGDSGSPVFLVLDGQAVVWWAFLFPDHGETPLDNLAALNTVLGSSYHLTYATLRALGSAGKADLGTAPGNVPFVLPGGLLDPAIVPGDGSVAAGVGAAGAATSTGLGGAPGAYTGPSVTMKSGDGGASASAYNGGAGGPFVFNFTMRGGVGGASSAGSTGGTGGIGGGAGNGIFIVGGDGGTSNGANGGNGAIGGSIKLQGGKGGTGTSTYGPGANGAPAGGIDLSGGSAGFGSNAIYPGGAGGAVIATGSNAVGGHAGYQGGTLNMSASTTAPGGSIDTSGGGGAISTKPVPFASAPSPAREGSTQPFTDSATNTWGDTITGGGSYHVQGYFNGTNWTVQAK